MGISIFSEGIIMTDLAARRDRIDKVKKVFLIIKIVCMVLVAVIATAYLLFLQYSAPYIEKDRASEISMEGFLKYFEEPTNMLLSVSYGICSAIAFAFVVFLLFHGIQILVIRFMSRNN